VLERTLHTGLLGTGISYQPTLLIFSLLCHFRQTITRVDFSDFLVID